MSKKEIERFQSDILVKPKLAEKVKMDTKHLGLGAIVDAANREGYEFDVKELKAFVVAKSAGRLSDETLASVSAAGSSTTVTHTNTVAQTAAIAQIIIVVEVYGVAAAVVVVT